MIVNTSFMLFGCANPASQAIVRAQLLHGALLKEAYWLRHTVQETISLSQLAVSNSADGREANSSSRSPFYNKQS